MAKDGWYQDPCFQASHSEWNRSKSTRCIGSYSAIEAGLAFRSQGLLTAEDDLDVFYQKWRSPICRSLSLALGDVGFCEQIRALVESCAPQVAHKIRAVTPSLAARGSRLGD